MDKPTTDAAWNRRKSERQVAARVIRYGEYLGAVRRKKRVVSYNEVFQLEKDGPHHPHLRLVDVFLLDDVALQRQAACRIAGAVS